MKESRLRSDKQYIMIELKCKENPALKETEFQLISESLRTQMIRNRLCCELPRGTVIPWDSFPFDHLRMLWHYMIDKDNVITFYFEDRQERMLILQALKDWRNESIHKDK